MGRPLKPKAEKQSKRVTVYLTPGEQAHLEALAKKDGLPLAALIMRPWRKEQ